MITISIVLASEATIPKLSQWIGEAVENRDVQDRDFSVDIRSIVVEADE